MKMLINGQAVDSSTGAVMEVLNPYDGTVIDTVPAASEEDVARAVECAVQAQKKWAKVPVFDRTEIVQRFISLVTEHQEELAQTLTAEMGKPINSARGEVSCARDAYTAFAEKARHIYNEMIPAGCEPGNEKTVLVTVREPLGVVACITPFNFPMHSFSLKTAPAIIAGNAVIVKPASDAPLTILKLGQLMTEAGLPEGVLQIVTGKCSSVFHLPRPKKSP